MPSPMSEPLPWNLVAPGYAAHNVAHFEHYAEAALELTDVGARHRVVDVACGPGTLTRLAALRGAEVHALDFSEAMLGALRRMVADEGLLNVIASHGDGQALPYSDGTFNRAFSMFGLMFFPDRAAGFRELQRVLAPAGQAVVSSWHPMEDLEIFRALFEALFAEAPDLMPDPESEAFAAPPPLSDPEQLHDEMAAAGFSVQIHAVSHVHAHPSLHAYWAASLESFAPLTLLRAQLGDERFIPLADAVFQRLLKRFGDGPVATEMPAWPAVGTKTL